MPLVIDAPDWGKDIAVLLDAAPRLLEADPEKNLLFSIHMWWPSDDASPDPGSRARITAALADAETRGVPLVVGEFANVAEKCRRWIDYRTIVAECARHGVGWLAWEWGPGNLDCAEMDMTKDGSFATLHGWGLEVATTDPASIKKTSRVPYSMAHGACYGHSLGGGAAH
jgi:mannan endo-1,4-beta-mannosidase